MYGIRVAKNLPAKTAAKGYAKTAGKKFSSAEMADCKGYVIACFPAWTGYSIASMQYRTTKRLHESLA